MNVARGRSGHRPRLPFDPRAFPPSEAKATLLPLDGDPAEQLEMLKRLSKKKRPPLRAASTSQQIITYSFYSKGSGTSSSSVGCTTTAFSKSNAGSSGISANPF
jgi:hypothetical protein